MTSLQMPVTIQLDPPEARPWGLLVDEATELPKDDFVIEGVSRLGLGVQHTPWGCDPLRVGNASCNPFFVLDGDAPGFDSGGNRIPANSTLTKDAAINDYDATVVHPAFKLVDGLTCSTMSFPDLNSNRYASMTNRLRARMRLLSSASLMTELITGWASAGPAFDDVTPMTAAATVAAAASAVEEHLAAKLHGGRGIVYIPPRLLPAAVAAFWVYEKGGRLVTVTGHRVVSDAGHTGKIGQGAAQTTKNWVFASGPVSYRIDDRELLGEGTDSTLDLFHNLRVRISEATAQLAFDPCALGAVLVG